MTRRDFELIAKAIAGSMRETNDTAGVELVAWRLSEALTDSNPRFDQMRFLNACGVQT